MPSREDMEDRGGLANYFTSGLEASFTSRRGRPPVIRAAEKVRIIRIFISVTLLDANCQCIFCVRIADFKFNKDEKNINALGRVYYITFGRKEFHKYVRQQKRFNVII